MLAELVGTFLLVLLGDAVVANVVLAQTKGNSSGWIVITLGWAMAIFVGATLSGGHLNPAVTLGLATAGLIDWSTVTSHIVGQFIGAFLGAIVMWAVFMPHFTATTDKNAILGAFSNSPAIRNPVANVIAEAVGTFVLVFGILILQKALFPAGSPAAAPINVGTLGALPVALLFLVIALGLGGTTGFALNPARDLAPRFVHAILPIWHKGSSDWAYGWIPVVGPIIGGLAAGLIYIGLSKF